MLSGLKAAAGETHGKTFRPLSASWFLLEQPGVSIAEVEFCSPSLSPAPTSTFLSAEAAEVVSDRVLLIVSIFQDVIYLIFSFYLFFPVSSPTC